MRFSNKGFTLIELLIVLVITGLTTSLLVTGLNSTWNNFDKLLARNLTLTSARLPAVWFENSIRGAILYHPEKVAFSGEEYEFTFVSSAGPNAANGAPRSLRWQIVDQLNSFALVFFTAANQQPITIYRFASQPRFEYLMIDGWKQEFKDVAGRLPEAVRIVYDDQMWAFSVPHRPIEADIPAELPMIGKYEF